MNQRMLHPPEAAEYVGGEKVLEAFINDWKLRPILKRKRLTLYDVKCLDAACDRIAGELPPSLK